MRGRVGSRQAERCVIAGALAAVTLLTAGCALFDPQSGLTLATVMEDHGDAVDVTANSREITDEVCGERLDCVEAYSTDEANYYRFSTREQAADHAASLHDGFVVNYVVMDFAGKDSSSKEHQQWAMERLAGTWQDYTGPFPAR